MAEVRREFWGQVRKRRPAAPTCLAGAFEVVLLQRLAPLLDGGGGEGGAVRVRDFLALGDGFNGKPEGAVAMIDPPVQ